MDSVVIIGAPRSGTNMLRDILTSFNGVGSWPCDEINYIWRYGNARYPSDELPARLATQRVINYIRRQFESLAKSQAVDVVLEKTCANSLRVGFVDRVLPDTKFIYIYRDGLDATGSARLRWKADLDVTYILKKVRFVPLLDLPYYANRYVANRLHRLFSKKKQLAFWGPTMENMDEILASHTLEEVCALQWQRCVESAEAALLGIAPKRVIRVCYEELVAAPEREIARILSFLRIPATDQQVKSATVGVSTTSIGKGRASLGKDQLERLETLVADALDRYGYRG